MLIPIEAIAVILYLANFHDLKSEFTLAQTLTAVFSAILLCAIFSALQTVIILLRGRLYTRGNRQIIKICAVNNKIISTVCTIMLFHITNAENLYQQFFSQMETDYILSNLTGMLLFILITAATWIPWYYIHIKNTPGIWNMFSYLLYRFRYTFFILGLWLPGLFLSKYLTDNPEVLDNPDLGLYSMFFLLFIAWVFPYFLKKFWGCKNLEDEQLRAEILHLAKKAGVNVRTICSWKLGGDSIPNAAMVGFLPPFRYLFISTGLLSRVGREEILGIVGHELGHLKKQHILFYLLMSISLLSIAEPLIYHYVDNHITAIVLLVGVFIVYIRFIFAWYSRRFEREADLFSAELLEDYKPLARGLEELGLICGNIRNDSSWHHYGIAQRVAFLRQCADDAGKKSSFKKNLLVVKLISLSLFAALIFYSFIMPAVDSVYSNRSKNRGYNYSEFRHWLQVSVLLPDSDAGPAKLLSYQQNKLNTDNLSPLDITLLIEKAHIYASLAKSRTDSEIKKEYYDQQLKIIERTGFARIKKR